MDTVVVQFVGSVDTLRVSRSALSSASQKFAKEFADGIKDTWGLDDDDRAPFKLFVQWLYTGRYHEYDCYAPGLYEETKEYSLEQTSDNTGNNIAWRVKAAMLACEFGHSLDAPAFQNYALARLSRAFQVDMPKIKVSPMMYQWSLRVSKLSLFIEDVVIRNWGDQNVVDYNDSEWAAALGVLKPFRDRFTKAVGLSLQERQQEPMVLEKYLVKED
jgi:hypothetical protein